MGSNCSILLLQYEYEENKLKIKNYNAYMHVQINGSRLSMRWNESLFCNILKPQLALPSDAINGTRHVLPTLFPCIIASHLQFPYHFVHA